MNKNQLAVQGSEENKVLQAYIAKGGNRLTAEHLIELKKGYTKEIIESIGKKPKEYIEQYEILLEQTNAMLDSDVKMNTFARLSTNTLTVNPLMHPHLTKAILSGNLAELASGVAYNNQQLELNFTTAAEATEAVAEIIEKNQEEGAEVTVRETTTEAEDGKTETKTEVTAKKDGKEGTVTVTSDDKASFLTELLKKLDQKKKIGGAARSVQEIAEDMAKVNGSQNGVVQVFGSVFNKITTALAGNEDKELGKNQGVKTILEYIDGIIAPMMLNKQDAYIIALLSIMQTFKVSIEAAKEIVVWMSYLFADYGVYKNKDTKALVKDLSYTDIADLAMESAIFDIAEFATSKRPQVKQVANLLGYKEEHPIETFISKLDSMVGLKTLVKAQTLSEESAMAIVNKREIAYYLGQKNAETKTDVEKAEAKDAPAKETTEEKKVETEAKKEKKEEISEKAKSRQERKAAKRAQQEAALAKKKGK